MCAFNGTTVGNQVGFLSCMDQHVGSALSASKICAGKVGLDLAAITTCYNGNEGQDLLAAASKIWNTQFPSRATVPHTFVDGADVDASYSSLKSALCKAGSTASVCSGHNTTSCVA